MKTPHTYQAGKFDEGVISLYDNNHFVIKDEFQNLSPRRMSRQDSAALRKTTWTRIGPDALAFDWSDRDSPDGEWTKKAAFRFGRKR